MLIETRARNDWLGRSQDRSTETELPLKRLEIVDMSKKRSKWSRRHRGLGRLAVSTSKLRFACRSLHFSNTFDYADFSPTRKINLRTRGYSAMLTFCCSCLFYESSIVTSFGAFLEASLRRDLARESSNNSEIKAGPNIRYDYTQSACNE